MITVETAPHEFAANYLFNEAGLSPFFAADSVVKAHGGSFTNEFRASGERWVAKLYYQDSNIVHPGDTTPFGSEFSVETIREFRVAVARHPEEDSVGEQSFNAHMSPRWEGMEAEKNDGERVDIPVPDGFREGVNIRVNGSNIEFERYHYLLLQAFIALDINPDYIADPHDMSNVQDAERYVRLLKHRSGPVHARDGPIASMGHLLENDRDGYRKVVQNDRDDHGNQLPGYYHTVTLDPRRIREAFPEHALPKEVKHYYAREAESKPEDDPLAHPKLGASYQVSRWDNKLGVTDAEISELSRELEETVLSVLADAGVPVRPPNGEGGAPFKPDAYFDAETQEHDDSPITDLDLTELRSEQESVVIRHISDGLSPVEWESLETLVTDGGEVSPKSIADSNDRHVDSVRRALGRIDDMVEREYGRVSLRSNYVAELVHEKVKEAKEATRAAVEAGAKAKEAAERGVDETTSALIAWAAQHDVDLDDSRDARMYLRMNSASPSEAVERVNEAYELWTDAKQDAARFREARVTFGDGYATPAWRLLKT